MKGKKLFYFFLSLLEEEYKFLYKVVRFFIWNINEYFYILYVQLKFFYFDFNLLDKYYNKIYSKVFKLQGYDDYKL